MYDFTQFSEFPKVSDSLVDLGEMDSDTQNEIMDVFRSIADSGECVILVSYFPEVVQMCDERFELKKVVPVKKTKKSTIL